MRVSVEQRHIDAGMDLTTAHPFSLAIKEELDKRPPPKGYLRVERVVSVSSSITVIEHRIIKRKGREETDLAWEKYWFGEPIKTTVKTPKGDKINEAYDLNHPAYTWMVAFGNKEGVSPIVLELVLGQENENGQDVEGQARQAPKAEAPVANPAPVARPRGQA